MPLMYYVGFYDSYYSYGGYDYSYYIFEYYAKETYNTSSFYDVDSGFYSFSTYQLEYYGLRYSTDTYYSYGHYAYGRSTTYLDKDFGGGDGYEIFDSHRTNFTYYDPGYSIYSSTQKDFSLTYMIGSEGVGYGYSYYSLYRSSNVYSNAGYGASYYSVYHSYGPSGPTYQVYSG